MRERARLVTKQPVDPVLHEPLLPAPDAGLGLAGAAHEFVGANAISAQQHDRGAPSVLLGGVAVSGSGPQAGDDPPPRG